jgi:hypothetical protein
MRMGECLNCGTPMEARFCPECGQPAIDPDPTLREFLHELAAELLHWDGKLISTFRLLLTKPGELTREHLAGRRVGYISPLRLYLTCSVLFFFLRALAPDAPMTIRTGSVAKTQVGPVTLQENKEGESLEALDRMARSQKPFDRAFGAHMGNALRHGSELGRALKENVPRTMFVLVPLFAALAAVVFRNRRMHYPQHLTFALHAHAFLFLALIPTLLPRVTTNAVVNSIAVAGSFLAIAVYMVLAVRHVYGGSLGGAVVRTGALAGIYFVAFTLAMLVTFAIVVAVMF